MNYPLVSIVIPTFNSERVLEKTLESIKKQTYPKSKIEIMVIDGGSKDNTVDIAKRFKCKVIKNPKVDLVYAKHIGFLKAHGKYLLNLDSDEVMESSDSIAMRVRVFKKNKDVKGIMTSGYKTPSDSSVINAYINNIGDPFSYFMHHLSQNSNFYLKQMLKRGEKIYEDNECIVLGFFAKSKSLPIIELSAAGGMIDREYIRETFPEIRKNPSLVLFYFYLLNLKHKFLAITKNDSIIHYSAGSISKYIKKILSRVKNNVYETTMGKAGFVGREQFQPPRFKYKRYFFIIYSLTLIFPFIESLYLVSSRRNLIYLIHVPLSLFTVGSIFYFFTLKTLGIKPEIKGYGN